MHQFVDAGIALYNPDKPDRPVNSPAAVYQIEPAALALLQSFNTKRLAWQPDGLPREAADPGRAVRHERKQKLVPVKIAPGQENRPQPGRA